METAPPPPPHKLKACDAMLDTALKMFAQSNIFVLNASVNLILKNYMVTLNLISCLI